MGSVCKGSIKKINPQNDKKLINGNNNKTKNRNSKDKKLSIEEKIKNKDKNLNNSKNEDKVPLSNLLKIDLQHHGKKICFY